MILKVTDNQYDLLSYRQLGFLFLSGFVENSSWLFMIIILSVNTGICVCCALMGKSVTKQSTT